MQRRRTLFSKLSTGLFAILLAVSMAGISGAQDQPTQDSQEKTGASEDKNAGLADLDEAMVKKIDASTPQQLEEITALVESAIAKGLDAEN